jgi:hypothetical protein
VTAPRSAIAGAFLAALSLVPTPGRCDPLTLRVALWGVTGQLAYSTRGSYFRGASLWLTPRVGLSADFQATTELALGTRFALLGAREGWGLDGFLAAGVGAQRVDAGLVLTATVAVQGRWTGRWLHLALGFASPMAAAPGTSGDVRVPTVLEARVFGRYQGLFGGVHGGAGVALVPGLSPSAVWDLALVLGVRLSDE